MEHLLVKSSSDQFMKTRAIKLVKDLFQEFEHDATEEIINSRMFGHNDNEVDILLADHEQAVGFGMSRKTNFEGQPVSYRIGTIIHPDYRDKKLYKDLVLKTTARHKARFVVTKTQVPRIYGAFQSIFGLVYPQIETPTLQMMKDIGQSVSSIPLDHASPYPIIRGIYHIDRTGRDDRLHKDERINQFFAKNLGVYDAFALVSVVLDNSPK